MKCDFLTSSLLRVEKSSAQFMKHRLIVNIGTVVQVSWSQPLKISCTTGFFPHCTAALNPRIPPPAKSHFNPSFCLVSINILRGWVTDLLKLLRLPADACGPRGITKTQRCAIKQIQMQYFQKGHHPWQGHLHQNQRAINRCIWRPLCTLSGNIFALGGGGHFHKDKKKKRKLPLPPLSSCRGWSLAAASLTILMRIQSPFSTSILIVLSPQFSGTCIYSFMGLPHPSEPLHLIFILQYFIRLALCLASHSVAPWLELFLHCPTSDHKVNLGRIIESIQQ